MFRFTIRDVLWMMVAVLAEHPCIAEIRVHVDGDAVVMFGVDDKMMERFIKDNELKPLDHWPVYGQTGLPNFRKPVPIQQRAMTEPAWTGRNLYGYKTSSESRPPHFRGANEEHVNRFFYHAQSQTLVVLHDERRWLPVP